MSALIVAGIVVGCVYCLVAAGYALVYRTTGILNFTQGSFVMLSGMGASWGLTNEHWSYPVAALAGIAISVLAGLGLWVFVLMPILMRRIAHVAVLATLVMSYIFQNAVLRWLGPNPVFLPNIQPSFTFRVFGASITSGQLYVVIGMAVILFLLSIFLRYTSLGRATRACAANREVSQLLGISPNRVGGYAMVICALIGGIAGLLIAPILPDSASGGTEIALYGFVAAVFGGFGRLSGGLIGGLAIGVIQELVTRYISGLYADAIVFSILLVMLVLRPEGILGEADTTRARGRGFHRRGPPRALLGDEDPTDVQPVGDAVVATP